MVFALVVPFSNLSSSNLFDLNLQTSGQQSPLPVYVYSVSKTLCQPCIRPLLLQTCRLMDESVVLQGKLLSLKASGLKTLNNYLAIRHKVGYRSRDPTGLKSPHTNSVR